MSVDENSKTQSSPPFPGDVYEVDNLRFANHAIDGLLLDMRRRAKGRRPGWLRDLFDD